MLSFSAIINTEQNKVCFDPLIKNDSYAFLYFKPTRGIPERFRVNVSVYRKDNILIEEYEFDLKLDNTKKSFDEHYIGVQQNGTTERVVFTTLNAENNTPLENICLEVAVVKIKDGDEDRDGGIKFKSKSPRAPVLFGC